MQYLDLETYVRDQWSPLYPEPWSATYGDGGSVNVSYNACVCPKLPIPPEIHTSLIENIQLVASKRNDVQENLVVEDIVDPDLYPRIIPSSDRSVQPEANNYNGEVVGSYPIHATYRGSYCWIPTDVEFTGESSVRFTSPIHNLPPTRRNESMYQCLETLLGAMLPGLMDVLPAIKSLKTFQVVVKVQRYRVPGGSTYSGQWHTEGVTEDVAAVGVYYAEWPSELSGGELKFRLTDAPDDDFRDRLRGRNSCEGLSICVPMTEGSAIAFSNEIPHRFKQLTNQTDTTLHRAFVNFFLIDPKKPKPSTHVVPTNADVYLALVGALVPDVISIVLEYLSMTPSSHASALSLRGLAKAEMVATKGKWGDINHGNCGTLHWLSEGIPPVAPPRTTGDEDDYDIDDDDGDYDDDDDTRGPKLSQYRNDCRQYSHTKTSSPRDATESLPGV